MIVRQAGAADAKAITGVVAAAFGRLDETRIVAGVRDEGAVVAELVVQEQDHIVGHVLFSRLTAAPPLFVVALAPLAVAPDYQNRGYGASLVLRGLAACQSSGAQACVVLGAPAYYGRFGFTAAPETLRSAYAGTPAFQSIAFVAGVLGRPVQLTYPRAFAG